MEYTVQQLAKLSGVSGRTLRYYDEIGLLKPARISSSGYRIYSQKELDLLQQILFYRELEVSLEEIKNIIHHPDFDLISALQQHVEKLEEKHTRLEQIISTVKKTIESKEGGTPMSDQEKFEGFKKKMIDENEEKYGKEVREQYGDHVVDDSKAKMMGLSEADFRRMNEVEKALFEALKNGYETGDPASPEAQKAAALHREWLSFTWPKYTKEAHAGLGDMYVSDERFTAYYDKHFEGAAVFLRDAIDVYTGK
ncbi:MerR family transcriptional regulator [Jeotgalibacillus haloalkalitolerans]|uniref:MerR family transcriptional regulator n=1 Tax=Jeotgalibacillus haloalkalitolerans TaxID=3104292 RepID=A0ABU5KPZ1_9BACL|nr:MerR family transcriptional regulator [Jeotgalibacillus sp. HH7-29]MDZ5712816.1 MerR family transcriptional regulator [Jeotgalibacillus sp. HH7-29]